MRIDVAQVFFVNDALRDILMWVEYQSGLDLTISKFHGQVKFKGVDIRVNYQKVGEMLCEMVNKKWQYDPLKPSYNCAEVCGQGSSLRVHIQVGERTKRIDEEAEIY